MKTTMARFAADAIAPLSGADAAALATLAARPDSDIDYSDIPALTAAQWQDAERGRFYRPLKQQITARLDADVLDWLKRQGKGYQSRMNGILRQAMLDARGKAK